MTDKDFAEATSSEDLDTIWKLSLNPFRINNVSLHYYTRHVSDIEF